MCVNLYIYFIFFLQAVDALGTLTVQSTVVDVKTHVPYYNLKVRFEDVSVSVMS